MLHVSVLLQLSQLGTHYLQYLTLLVVRVNNVPAAHLQVPSLLFVPDTTHESHFVADVHLAHPELHGLQSPLLS